MTSVFLSLELFLSNFDKKMSSGTGREDMGLLFTQTPGNNPQRSCFAMRHVGHAQPRELLTSGCVVFV